MADIRIDKYLSVALGISRSEAKILLKSGKISTDGKIISKPETKVSETAEVKCEGEILKYKKYIYLLMNKPEGILSASTDKRVKTVVDIVPDHLERAGLFPVGRLDKNTTGLLIITDDGDFGHKVTSPKSLIEKRYLAELDGKIEEEYITVFENGVTLADGEECMPARLEIVSDNIGIVTIKEGKYHQIKRMFGIVGLGVNKLKRLSIGKLTLPENLKEGSVKELEEADIRKIFQ